MFSENLSKIDSSNIVIANLGYSYELCTNNTAFEIGYAFSKHKRIIGYRDVDYISKPHSFEVIKIELLDFVESNSSISTPNSPNSQGGLSIRVAKLLQNVEKSYDKGRSNDALRYQTFQPQAW